VTLEQARAWIQQEPHDMRDDERMQGSGGISPMWYRSHMLWINTCAVLMLGLLPLIKFAPPVIVLLYGSATLLGVIAAFKTTPTMWFITGVCLTWLAVVWAVLAVVGLSGRGWLGMAPTRDPRSSFSGRNLASVNWSHADLSGVRLRGTDLDHATLNGARLVGIDAVGASFQHADLRYADLSGAVLRGADLRGACLYGARVYGAILLGADFTGADVTGTAGYSPSSGSVGWDERGASTSCAD
jgi:Pentapeptide repeats (8 copies)